MNLKIVGIALVSILIITAFYFFNNIFLNNKEKLVSLNNFNQNILSDKKNETIILKSPINWIEGNQKNQANQNEKINQSQRSDIFSETLSNINLKIQKSVDFVQNTEKNNQNKNDETADKTNVSSNKQNSEEYLIKVLEAWSKNGFTEEEFSLIKKNKNGLPLSLEELIQTAISGTNLNELSASFKVWQTLDDRTLNDLRKISADSKFSNINQPIIYWYEYHSQIAQKLSSGNLSSAELNDLFNQYLKKAKTETPNIFQVLTPIKKSISLIPEAQAQTQATFYDFGGLVASYVDTCTDGIAVMITGVKGGILWIYYSAWAVNPFLYKMLAPDYYVLGRALWGPGICNKGTVSYPEGIAQIIFFGSSASPL